MFEHPVLVTSNSHNVSLLRKMGLKPGVDYRSEKGAASRGRPDCLLLKFKDKDKALFFKLRTIA